MFWSGWDPLDSAEGEIVIFYLVLNTHHQNVTSLKLSLWFPCDNRMKGGEAQQFGMWWGFWSLVLLTPPLPWVLQPLLSGCSSHTQRSNQAQWVKPVSHCTWDFFSVSNALYPQPYQPSSHTWRTTSWRLSCCSTFSVPWGLTGDCMPLPIAMVLDFFKFSQLILLFCIL